MKYAYNQYCTVMDKGRVPVSTVPYIFILWGYVLLLHDPPERPPCF